MDNEHTVQDLISLSYEQKPIDFQQAFDSLMLDRISKAVENRKVEIASSMFNDQEEIESEEDTDIEQESESEEETENGETA